MNFERLHSRTRREIFEVGRLWGQFDSVSVMNYEGVSI